MVAGRVTSFVVLLADKLVQMYWEVLENSHRDILLSLARKVLSINYLYSPKINNYYQKKCIVSNNISLRCVDRDRSNR